MRYSKKLQDSATVIGTSPTAEILKGAPRGSVFLYKADAKWSGAWSQNAGDPGHRGSLELFTIEGYGRNYDRFVGAPGVYNKLVLEDGKQALFLDDPFSPFGDKPRIENIQEIVAGAGGQVIDLTTDRFGYGNVKILGGSGDDVLMSSSGADYVNGANGKDYVWGGSGNDEAVGGAGNDRVFGADGDDVARGGQDNDQVSGGEGNDTVYGDTGDDVARGDNGNDTVMGNDGNDQVFGDKGNDTVYGDKGDDTVSGGDGDDVVYGNTGNDGVEGGAGNDKVLGNEGNDKVSGGDGDDRVEGNTGDDAVNGGAGNDVVVGGKGNDLLIGGVGNDRFQWDKGDVAGTTWKFTDHVQDFAKGDTLDFSAVIGNGADNDATHFVKFEDTGDGTNVWVALSAGKEFYLAAVLDSAHGLDVGAAQNEGWLLI